MSRPEEVLPLEPEVPDADLVRRSLAGDTAAFGTLYARHATPVATYVRRALPGARVDVTDAVQDAFVRAWCRLPQLRASDRFSAWVRAIAVASARDALRAAAREVAVGEPAEAPTAPDGLDDTLAVRQAVRALPPPQRAAVALCYLQGLSPEEASRRLGVPATTVRGRLQTGRAALRARLARGGAWAGPSSASAGTRRPLQEVLAAIRRRNLEQTHDPRGRTVVLFCGVPLSVDVVPSADGLLHLRGSVWGVGEEAISAVALRHDGVDDALAVGPHPGMLFAGTRGNHGRLETIVESTERWWGRLRPDLEGAEGAGDVVARHMGAILRAAALRLSVVASRVNGAWVGETDAARWSELSRVLSVNHTSEQGWHGPEVCGALTVEVPEGATLAVVTLGLTGSVTAREVRGQIACVGSSAVTVERHVGELTLWEAHLRTVAGLRGALRQRLRSYMGGACEDGRFHRGRVPEVAIAGWMVRPTLSSGGCNSPWTPRAAPSRCITASGTPHCAWGPNSP